MGGVYALMSWRILGTIAGKAGLDPDTVTKGAERLAASAQKLASSAVEHGMPVAKRVVQQATTVATGVVDELVKKAKSSGGAAAEALPAPAAKKTPAKRSAAKADAPVAAAVEPRVETVVSVRVKAQPALDLSGLSITADDVKELERIPAGFGEAIMHGARGRPVDHDVAKAVYEYIVGTTPGIIDSGKRVAVDANELAERTGREPFELSSLWGKLLSAPDVLSAYDKVHGTDLAATAWLTMVASWDPQAIEPYPGRALDAVWRGILCASKSSRPQEHAAKAFELVLRYSRMEGWPSSLFRDSGSLDTFFALARSAVDHPDQREAVAAKLQSVAWAMMAAPVTEGATRMNPHVLRQELAEGAIAALKALGHTDTTVLENAARAAAEHPDAKVTDTELRELDLYPRWLADTKRSSDNGYELARTKMTPDQAAELARFISAPRGDIGAFESRLRSHWVSPTTCAVLAAHAGVTPNPPKDGGHTGNIVSYATDVVKNVAHALDLLAIYDKAHGTQLAPAAARAALTHAAPSERTAKIVTAARGVFAASSATVDDKRFFLDQIPELVRAGAWTPPTTIDDSSQICALIDGVTEAAKADEAVARQIFIAMFPVVSTAAQDESTWDQVGRRIIAKHTSEVAAALGRTADAENFGFMQRQLAEKLGE